MYRTLKSVGKRSSHPQMFKCNYITLASSEIGLNVPINTNNKSVDSMDIFSYLSSILMFFRAKKIYRENCYSIILILDTSSNTTILSHRLCIFDLPCCSSVPWSFLCFCNMPSIFSLQTNLQPNSHPILILSLLQCSFLHPRVDRYRDRKGKKNKTKTWVQRQVDTSV